MGSNKTIRKQQSQKKYRKSQNIKGLVRFELQVPIKAKERFEEMVNAAAEEYDIPWDKRRRLSAARAAIFDEITQGLTHEFTALVRQIETLKAEIQALAPSFFKTKQTDNVPLPESIRALPDDPIRLKPLLATTYSEYQAAKRTAIHYQRQAEQFEKLYETASNYSDDLMQRLTELGYDISE